MSSATAAPSRREARLSEYSEFVAAQLATLAAIDTVSGTVIDVDAALASYTSLFNDLLYLGLGVAALLLLISPLLKKMMHGIH